MVKTKAESSSTVVLSKLLTQAEAAAVLHVAVSTLAVWRSTQRYPLKYVKIGGKVLYREADLEAFILDRTRTQTTHVLRAEKKFAG